MPKPNPIIKFLDILLPPDLHHLIGDLMEEYHLNKKREGVLRARFLFGSQLLRSLPWFILQSLIWNTEMLYNYLKVTWRNLRKYTGFSLINIFGLAASMSICLLIIVFVIDQMSYDKFHEKGDRIVRVITDYKSPYNDNSTLYATSPDALGGILEAQFPQVEKAIDLRGNFNGEFRYQDKILPLEGIYAGPGFLTEFGFKMIRGDTESALNEPGNLLLTPKSAEKLFGEEDPVGKVITGLGDRDYTVTGIIDNDRQTHFRFEVVASHTTLTANAEQQAILDNWKNSIYDSYTYLLLQKNTDLNKFENDIQSVIKPNFFDPEEESVLKYLQIQPLTKINLGPALSNEIGLVMPGFIVWFLIGFAVIIMLIASFNYVSLTIARSLNRSREVGVRKVLGAHRMSVIKQFLFESTLISLIALFFSSFLLQWLLPEFNSLFFISFTDNQVEPGMITHPAVILIFILFSILIGVLAGLYPSMYLSSFSPSRVLKGTFNLNRISGQTLKKILTVSQFTFSLIFLITSLILFQQFKFMGNTDYGFNRKNIVNVALQDVSYDQLKYELENSPNVASMAATSKVPAMSSIHGVWLDSDSIDTHINAHSFRVDENYIQTMGLNLLSGRNFNPEMGTDTSRAVIISDQAVRQLGFQNPADALNKQVMLNEAPYTVIGIIENFISADPTRAGDPIVLLYQPKSTHYAVIKTPPGRTTDLIHELEETWLTFNSVYSMKYKIFDEQLKENPTLVVFGDFIKILGLLGGFSVLISCLGLLGMAMYSAENRVKEIGIRKVLGASVKNIVLLLSREYLVLIGIALTLGLPLSWFINNLWMKVVTNKVGLHPGVFILGASTVLLLAIITIGSQALRAARTNSIENLRSE